MGQPKKRSSARRTGMRRSHLVLKLARQVNAKSPVKVRTTKRESGSATKKAPAPQPKAEAKKSAAPVKASVKKASKK